ncbi:hypothetical protein LCGC14_2746030 [marine sediment metagenome]|uniref:Uncharacterized protein n=1 Tax=marine sediment metagenome TaxID=412755 RepID=A0A0F9BBX5_9ZZZZ
MTMNMRKMKPEMIKLFGRVEPKSFIIEDLHSFIEADPQFLPYAQRVLAILKENIVFPLVKEESDTFNLKDQKGCRILDYRVLANNQVKDYMMLNGNFDIVKMPHIPPMTLAIKHIIGDDLHDNINEIEVYDKLLNVTYKVDDDFLFKWFNPDYIDKNIAHKQVQNCSVRELLFAIKSKLEYGNNK